MLRPARQVPVLDAFSSLRNIRMTPQVTAFLFAILLGAISSAIGFALYKYGSAYIKYKGARFGGAVAVAGVAFILMSQFYFKQIEMGDQGLESERLKVVEALKDYDTCLAQEKEVSSCKHQSNVLRDACGGLMR
jgi:hypothetical protein